MDDYINDNDDIQQRLILETAQIPWKELQYFFARGMAIYISEGLDLVDVAKHFTEDNKPVVEHWMQLGKISNVSNEQAKRWYAADVIVWAVVVKPWVLVQELQAGQLKSD